MEEFKTLLASKTFWGGIIAVISGVLGFFGYAVTIEDQNALAAIGLGLYTNLIGAYTAIGALIGGVIAIYGRIKATKKIR